MSLLFNMVSRLVITFLPRSKRLLISWLQPPSAVILEPPKMKSDTVSTVSPSISHTWGYIKGLWKLPNGRDWWWVGLDFVSIMGKAMLSRTLICSYADDWSFVPFMLVVWPDTAQHWSLQVVWWSECCPSGGLMLMNPSPNCCYYHLCPCGEPQPPLTSSGDPLILADLFDLVPYGVIPFLPWSWYI